MRLSSTFEGGMQLKYVLKQRRDISEVMYWSFFPQPVLELRGWNVTEIPCCNEGGTAIRQTPTPHHLLYINGRM